MSIQNEKTKKIVSEFDVVDDVNELADVHVKIDGNNIIISQGGRLPIYLTKCMAAELKRMWSDLEE